VYKFKNFLKQSYVFIFLIATYVPLVLIILISFNGVTSRGNIDTNFSTPTVVNYLTLFGDNQFVNALLNSLLLGLVVTPIVIIIATLTCFGI
jgi:spermidine/putrescine transport system permease protein